MQAFAAKSLMILQAKLKAAEAREAALQCSLEEAMAQQATLRSSLRTAQVCFKHLCTRATHTLVRIRACTPALCTLLIILSAWVLGFLLFLLPGALYRCRELEQPRAPHPNHY
jgi:hypothetical protein